MKKILALLCTAALVISLTACSRNTEYAGTTKIGKVTKIKNSTVTLQLGELTESENSAPEKPSDENGENTSDSEKSTPPEKPNGESASGGDSTNNDAADSDKQQPNNTQNGENSGSDSNTPPEMPGKSQTFTAGKETAVVDISNSSVVKDSEVISVDKISKGDVLKISFDNLGRAKTVIVVSSSSQNGGSDNVNQGDSANTIDKDSTVKNKTYSSSGDDENALRVDGSTVTLSDITVDKSGGKSSSTEDGDFYGMNAALLATNGATVTIKNATIKSSAQNGNGVFSYGSGTTVNISNSKITTTADNSGGIQTTGGATTNAENLTVNTSGNSSAAIRSDRGGGTVNVKGGSYTSNGYNSPAVYSTANISVSDAELTANNSEALVIEGKNSITLKNCTVSGNMSSTKGTSSDENVHNVMIYQSMSGDADVGTSEFSMTGGKLISNNGDMFYITNTSSKITLSGVALTNNGSNGYLMNICGNSASRGWGAAGKNGGNVTFTAENQTLDGNIVVDKISTLNMTLKSGSVFNGTVNITENKENGTAVSDNAVITIESGCTWNLTGNCTVTSLENNGNINFNGYTITLADGTVLK